jgi:hypothetical protein
VTLLSERNPCVSVGVDVLKDLSLAEWISISIECCLWKGSGLCTMSSSEKVRTIVTNFCEKGYRSRKSDIIFKILVYYSTYCTRL